MPITAPVDVGWFAFGVTIAAGSILVYSGISKLVTPSALRSTLVELGVADRLVSLGNVAIPPTEVAVGVLVVLSGTPSSSLLLVAMGSSFALAGIVALLTGRSINCSCFGHRKPSKLGWRQVAQLPLWLGAATGLEIAGGTQPSLETRTALLGLSLMIVWASFSLELLQGVAKLWSFRRAVRL